MLYMWWTCKKIKEYWDVIYNELKRIIKVPFVKQTNKQTLGFPSGDFRLTYPKM